MSYNGNDDYKKDIRLDGAAPSAPPHPHYAYPPPARRPSRFWIFILSVLPGLGHIYLGLIRRGLFYISALALVIFFKVMVIPIFAPVAIFTGFSIAALYAVSFFEAFGIRRDIIMGKEVKDVIPNIGPLGKNKSLLAVLIVIVVVSLAINIVSALPWYAWLVLGIVAVCYFRGIIGKRRGGGNQEDSNK
ncbi:MAG: hypothetical protein FWC93_00210 [Defluviitaleaceae bacterium]|nr:hypothetical protein [Defluviitaleaceae bacterium]